MKVFTMVIKIKESKRVYLRAKDEKAAEKAFRDSVTMKKIHGLDTEISYGKVSEAMESSFPDPKKKTVKKIKR